MTEKIIVATPENINESFIKHIYEQILIYGRCFVEFKEENKEACSRAAQNFVADKLANLCKCGGVMSRKNDVVLTSLPPKYLYVCDTCRAQTYREI